MKKPALPRFAVLVFIYSLTLVSLVMIQFVRRGNFTMRAGNMVITGRYAPEEDSESRSADGRRETSAFHRLQGGAGVYFGGLEFSLDGPGEGLALLDGSGGRTPVLPEFLVLAGDAATFTFPGGTELAFTTRYSGGSLELRISAALGGETAALELPYKPLKSSRVRNSGGGEMVINSGGTDYTFGRLTDGAEDRLLSFKADGDSVSYRAVPEKRAFNPEDFVLAGAESRETYAAAMSRWRDQNFSIWNRTVQTTADEDVIVACAAEAVRRGVYRAAVSAVSSAFLGGPRRTYESSVYLGRMGEARISFTAAERDRISRISRLINEKSSGFLGESHVFEFLAVRGYLNFLNDGVELIRSIDPSSLSPELAPGIFEGFMDMKQYRGREENPFERLADQACFVISEGIHSDGGRVFVFQGGAADVEFNLRLGSGLLAWAEDSGSPGWAGVGRSLVLSVLSLTAEDGTLPASLSVSDGGIISENPGPRLAAAKLYRIMRAGDYYPRAAGIGAGVNGIWTWTAASAVSASQENNILDISVGFPAGETHYMMIRGVRPFTKLQLYNIDYRTDPQFERYDSSGWVYLPEDQLLVIKMKHRAALEHIRIFY
ncbi:MAG: hypothetical protein LBI86_01945 [Treponema sp.]|jgi:hypothetical protein|nr:hypothetical protein [Treponema sp.]